MTEVLAEERKRGEEQTKPSVCIVPPEEEKGEEKAGEEDGGEEEGEDEAELSLELEEILKTCDAIQETTSHVGVEATVEREEKRETGEGCSSVDGVPAVLFFHGIQRVLLVTYCAPVL